MDDARGRAMVLEELAEDIFGGVNVDRLLDDPSQPPRAVIAVGDIVDGALVPAEGMAKTRGRFEGRSAHHPLREGDVVVSTRGTLLKTAVVGTAHVGAVASCNLAVVRPNGVLEPTLIAAALRSDGTRRRLLQEATGGNVPGLYIATLKQARIRVPPKDVQAALARLHEASDREYALATRIARERRDAALQTVFSVITEGEGL
jgi:restriction endonuclease S subunit